MGIDPQSTSTKFTSLEIRGIINEQERKTSAERYAKS